VFHLDFDPPPTNEPGLIERLQDLVPPEVVPATCCSPPRQSAQPA